MVQPNYLGQVIGTKGCSREFPGSRFPGNSQFLAIFPVFPGKAGRETREFPGFPGKLANFRFPVSREMKKSGKMQALFMSQEYSEGT